MANPRMIPSDETAKLVAFGLKLLGSDRAADLLQMIAGLHPDGPRDPRLRVQQAYAHALTGQLGLALIAADQLETAVSEHWTLDMLGHTFVRCHRPDRAYAAFCRAQRLAPGSPQALFNLATAAGFVGRSQEAEQAYDRVIAIAPDNAEAFLNRSALRRQTPDANHVAQLRQALNRPLPWPGEVSLGYALGKELEDLGDHDGAFAQIAQGAALRRRNMRYDVNNDIEAMQRIAAVHDARWCRPAADPAAHGGGPVFILGMPRSGSTLLERMLGRHGDIQPLGELPFFGQALVGAFRAASGRMPSGKAELIDRSAALHPPAIGERYLAAVDPLRDSAAPRFTDKLPINFLYAGLIARALPNAALLHIRRDPLDLCYAIYKTLFRDAYPFSYDLEELAAYRRAYEALMAHWRGALGERLIEVDYEDLVTAPQDTIERLLHRLGLGFEASCVNPQDACGAVMTASAAQVRQPIHAESIGSASRHAHRLAGLGATLGDGDAAGAPRA